MTIVGRVYDRADRPITGAVVEITEAATYAYFSETTVRTNHDGYFRAERLPVGRWTVSARHGEQKARQTVEGGARETIEADLMLGGIQIDGEIWLGNNRAQGGTLVLTTDDSQAAGVVVMMQRLTADRQIFGIDQQPVQFAVSADGRFTGNGLEAGRYYAAYTPPEAGAAPVSKILDIPYVESFQCAIQYADASVTGVVVDTGGQPVAGASVVAVAGDGVQEVSAFTDGGGRFSVKGLEPGQLVLTANHTEFSESDPVQLELRDGYAEGPLVLELQPADGADIALTVIAAAGSAGGAPSTWWDQKPPPASPMAVVWPRSPVSVPARTVPADSPTAAPQGAGRTSSSTMETTSRLSSSSARAATWMSGWTRHRAPRWGPKPCRPSGGLRCGSKPPTMSISRACCRWPVRHKPSAAASASVRSSRTTTSSS
jgi:hypothetical protein